MPPTLSGIDFPASGTSVNCRAVPAKSTVFARDDCDPSPVISTHEIMSAETCKGNYTLLRVWTAMDACGNTVSQQQLLNVRVRVLLLLHVL